MALNCVTFWSGNLGPVERACLRSVLTQGHALSLYCYQRPANVPKGVSICDASTILPEQVLLSYGAGSIAIFSDRFRYELLRRSLGTWVDTDMYLVNELDESSLYLYGKQEPGIINNAVLRVPADSQLLAELLEIFQEERIPTWLNFRQYFSAYYRKCITSKTGVSRMPWGTTGPGAMTALTHALGLEKLAAPSAIFYPVHWRQANWILDPSINACDVVSKTTVGIHLWNEVIRGFKNSSAPSGSFLERLHVEGRI